MGQNNINRIKDLRAQAGISQEELGAQMASDITGSTVAKLENGRLRLSLEYAQEIADVFGVSLFEVLGLGSDGVRVIPAIGWVHAGAWEEMTASTDDEQAIPGDVKGRDLFALRVEGDSMNMVVNEGGYIVVDPHDLDLIEGRYYVVKNGHDEATFKQFKTNPLRLAPCSKNPVHQAIVVGSEAFTVIGRVVYSGQSL